MLYCKELLYEFNFSRPTELEKINEIIKKLFNKIGKNYYIEPPFHANWGCNLHVGDNFYANFNLTVDDTDIFIGDNVMIGAGSVVTEDIPRGVVAIGNLCRVIRKINDNDYKYYHKDKKIMV